MSFNTQEQEIIKYGATNGKTRQEVEQAITNLRSGIIPAKPVAQEQSITQDIVGDFKGIGEGILKTSEQRAGNILEIKSGLDSGQKSPASAIFQTAGQLAGAGADAIGETFKGVVKLALTPKGEARTKELVSSFGEKVVERPETQKLIKWYEGLTPETQDNLDAVGGFASLAAEFVGLGAGQKGAILAKEGVSTGLDIAKQGAGEMVEETFKLGKNLVPKSPDIMNRVARLTPTQARKFKSLAGESHGDYLTRTGNFGTPDKIVETEAIKFSQSIKSVDDTLATLPGVYKDGVIDDVLEGLTERVALTSSKNVPSPMASKVAKLTAKNAEDGLTMGDINEMKRLYEREVKLGYNKMLNPDKVQMATNIDNALREWQVAKAEELGFTNLKELNKQTQISRNIINSLGDQVVGKTGLNNVTLTDWIMLSGGDPTAIAGFLTKKFFGSKGVQSKIAEMLSDIKPAEGIIKPKVTPSKQTPPLLPRKVLKRPSPNTTPKSTFNNPTVGQTVDNSAKEAVAKGLTEEQYVKGQTLVYHGSPEPLKKFEKRGAFFTEEYADATGFAGTPDNVYEGYLNLKKPLVIDAKGKKWDEIVSPYGKSTQEIISNAKKTKDFDGVVFKNVIDNIADDVEAGVPGTIRYPFDANKSFINESQLRAEYQAALKAKK